MHDVTYTLQCVVWPRIILAPAFQASSLLSLVPCPSHPCLMNIFKSLISTSGCKYSNFPLSKQVLRQYVIWPLFPPETPSIPGFCSPCLSPIFLAVLPWSPSKAWLFGPVLVGVHRVPCWILLLLPVLFGPAHHSGQHLWSNSSTELWFSKCLHLGDLMSPTKVDASPLKCFSYIIQQCLMAALSCKHENQGSLPLLAASQPISEFCLFSPTHVPSAATQFRRSLFCFWTPTVIKLV